MIGVLLGREDLRTDRPTGRMVYEHEDRAQGNVFKRRSVRGLGEVWSRVLPGAFRGMVLAIP